MKTYVVRVYDINGRIISTEDDDELQAARWLWRTLTRVAEARKGYRPTVEFLTVSDHLS